MKITILTYVEREGSRDHDEVVGQVARALRQGKHTPSVLGVHNDLGRMISRLKRRQPDLVFNLVEMFNKQLKGDVEVAAVLDLLDISYTGGGPAELSLRVDKGLAKKVLAFDKILYPDFAVFSRTDLETGGNLRFPLFVKPLKADASIGIGADSLVRDAPALMERVAAIHKKFDDAALAEEYIEGREF
jgi:D-alanine-D-alanine ligase